MAEDATYALYIDWNDDGDFGEANEDVSDDLIAATVTRGFADSLKRVAGVGRMTCVLDNEAQTYSPPFSSDARPWRAAKLDMTYSGTTRTLFAGYLNTIRPTPGRFEDRQATVLCVDAMRKLERDQGRIALQTDVRAHDLIEDVVAAVYTPSSTSYENGLNVFVTSTPRWVFQESDLTEEINAAQKITEICASDWGRFFIAADGTPTYYNRHHIPLDDTVAFALDNDMLRMAYQQAADDIFSEVNATVFPRSIGVIPEVLGKIDQRDAPRIEASDTLTLTVYFRDTVNAKVRIGGLDVVEPVADTDYACTSDPEGEGDDETANVTVSSFDTYSDQVKITLSNAAAHPVYVQRLRVRGTAVRSREQVTVTETGTNEGVPFDVRTPLLDDVFDGTALAEHLINRRGDAVHDVRNVQVVANESAARMAAVRDAELLQRVTLTEAQTGLSSLAGYIYWLQHDIVRGHHTMTFHVGPQYTYSGDPFTIGTSTIGGTDVLIY
jgi:hypothetical protein